MRFKAITHNNAPEQSVQWSPEGRLISYLAPSDTLVGSGGGEAVGRAEQKAATPRRLTGSFKGSIGQYTLSADGRSIVFGAHTPRARERSIGSTLAAARSRRSPAATGRAASNRCPPTGRRGAVVVSTPTAPGDVNIVNLATGTLTPITHANPKVGDFALAQFRAITWKSPDGLDVEGMLWLPADYKPGARLPLLLSVHGGPAGAWDVSFRGINHVYTGLGWAMLEPNVRGSSSYGDALLRGNMKDIGGGDYQDLMSGVDKLIANGIADPEHLAIRGWSYGGILGGWTLTADDPLQGGVAGAMVSDWTSEYAMGFNHDVRLWYIGGTHGKAPRISPTIIVTHIAKVTTPTLLLHGERDTTDTIGQSMMYSRG